MSNRLGRSTIFLCICLFGLMANAVFSQSLVISFQNQANSRVSDLWHLKVQNPGEKPVDMWFEVQIKQNSYMVYAARTEVVRVSNTLTILNQFSLNLLSQEFGSPELDDFISSTGQLPAGQYNGCLKAYVGTSEISRICKEMKVDLLSPPTLVYPYNQQNISTLTPSLSWLPPIPSSIQGISYSLKLVEILAGQTANEAVLRNAPLVWSENLERNMLPYPADGQSLEFGKKYAWHVEAFVGNYSMGKSQVWEFTPSQKQAKVEERISAQAYFDLNRQENPGELAIVKLLKLKYTERTSKGMLALSLVDHEAHPIKLKSNKLKSKNGDNYFEVDLSKVKGIKHEEHYAMEVLLPEGQRVVVNFQYLDPDRL